METQCAGVLLLIMGTGLSPRREDQQPSRLETIRRLYFYAVFLVSLIAGMVALEQLLNVLCEVWLSDNLGLGDERWARNTIASSAGVLVVATPIFLLHWGYIQRRLDSSIERQAALRKFALYVAEAITLGYAIYAIFELLRGVAFLAVGGPRDESLILPSDWLYLILLGVAACALQLYFNHVLLQDGDYGNEQGIAGVWRRLYQAAAGLLGLFFVIFGTALLIDVALQSLVDAVEPGIGTRFWRDQLSSSLALLLTGAVVTRGNWQRWHATIADYPREGQTGLRRFYLYAALIVSALAALVPATFLLRELLLMLFGSGTGSLVQLLDDLTTPLAFLPVGIVAWTWYRRYLRLEAEQYGDSAESTTMRRIYAYVVSATALGLLWGGSVLIVSALIDWLIGPGAFATENDFWLEPLATGLSLLAVGAPVWSIHWRSVQAVARQEDNAGADERKSGPRRTYLYGVALVSALFVLFSFAQVIYRLFLWLLGDPDAGVLTVQTADEIARSIIALIIWGYHVWAIRVDGQMTSPEPEPVEQGVEMDERQRLVEHIAALEQALAEARQSLDDLDGEETAEENDRD